MTSFVLDSSLSAAWCFPEERTDYTNAVLLSLGAQGEPIVPRLWAYEIRNCVLMGSRRRRIAKAEAEDFLTSLQCLPIRLSDPVSYDAVFQLADRQGLTVYDAAYLDLAMREQLPIASLDSALIHAANQVGVMVFQPAA